MSMEKTYQGFNILDVTSMDKLREILLPGRKGRQLASTANVDPEPH